MAAHRNNFRTWVKTRLVQADLTVAQMADRIGYPRRTVSAAIHGAAFPHVVASIAKFLKHDPKTDGPLPARPARAELRVRLAAK